MKVSLLASYFYVRKWKPSMLASLVSHPDVELLIDSGAFSAKNRGVEVSLDEYMGFLRDHKSSLFGYIALDVLQNPVATDTNLKTMLAAGLKPIPVHVFGDDQRRMDELFTFSDWVALGGLRRPHRGLARPDYVAHKMKMAAGRRVHWLGYTSVEMVGAWKPYSCDSASWAGGMMYGHLDVYTGQGKFVRLKYDDFVSSRALLRPSIAAAMQRFQVPSGHIMDRRRWRNGNLKLHGIRSSDCVTVYLNARSWVDYALDLRRRFGTRLFLALSASEDHLRPVLDAVDLARTNGAMVP